MRERRSFPDEQVKSSFIGISRREKAMWDTIFTLLKFLGLIVAGISGCIAAIAEKENKSPSGPPPRSPFVRVLFTKESAFLWVVAGVTVSLLSQAVETGKAKRDAAETRSKDQAQQERTGEGLKLAQQSLARIESVITTIHKLEMDIEFELPRANTNFLGFFNSMSEFEALADHRKSLWDAKVHLDLDDNLMLPTNLKTSYFDLHPFRDKIDPVIAINAFGPAPNQAWISITINRQKPAGYKSIETTPGGDLPLECVASWIPEWFYYNSMSHQYFVEWKGLKLSKISSNLKINGIVDLSEAQILIMLSDRIGNPPDRTVVWALEPKRLELHINDHKLVLTNFVALTNKEPYYEAKLPTLEDILTERTYQRNPYND